MSDRQMSLLVMLVRRLALRDFGLDIENGKVEEVLRDLLWGPRDLRGAGDSGLITKTEAAQALADRVHAWLADLSGPKWPPESSERWADDVPELERALFPQDGGT